MEINNAMRTPISICTRKVNARNGLPSSVCVYTGQYSLLCVLRCATITPGYNIALVYGFQTVIASLIIKNFKYPFVERQKKKNTHGTICRHCDSNVCKI